MNIVDKVLVKPHTSALVKSEVLTVSSAHLTYQDRNKLAEISRSKNAFMSVIDSGCGVLIRGITELNINSAIIEGFSQTFPGILKLAFVNGCDTVLLEPEGNEIAGFSVYEW